MAKKTTSKTGKTNSKVTKQPPHAAAKTETETGAKPQKERKKAAAKAEPARAAAKALPAQEPRPRDPRLPAPGTVLQKKDRQGNMRCECTVEAGGVRYNGTIYRSLSSAAMAASKELGLGGQAQNGFLFWGLVKQAPREKDPIAALEHAWERFRARAEGVLKTAVTDENRAKVLSTVKKHVDALEGLRESVA
jgi:hypothetical protein